jgi:hypothetical protein
MRLSCLFSDCRVSHDHEAVLSFLSRDFVLRHNLPFSPASLPVALADGSRIPSLGTAKVKVQIKKYAHTLTL